MEKKEFLEAAKIINTHGVSGEVKLESYCDSADVLKKLPALYIDGKEYKLVRSRVIPGDFVLAVLDGISDLNAAIRLKGKTAYARREDLPKKEGAHFIADLIGLPVIDARTGKVYGTLGDVQTPAKTEIFYIDTGAKEPVMLPHVGEYVESIDEERGIFVTPIPGFFDGGDDEV